ncbi:MAG: hypothetical protein Q9196_000882 [Gyalolechia fulgens]
MSNYEKLTVAKLRDELTKRGLPKAGLKAVLVQRLVEADEDSTQEKPVANDTESQPAEGDSPEETPPVPAAQQEQHNESPGTHSEGEEREDTTLPSRSPPGIRSVPIEAENAPLSTNKPEAVDTEVGSTHGKEVKTLSQIDAVDVTLEADKLGQDVPTATSSKDSVQARHEVGTPIVLITQPEKPAPDEDGPAVSLSRQDSVNKEEALEDMKKRKRRSTTPPPSAESVQKKAKIGDGRPAVKLPEDISMEDVDATPVADAPIEHLSDTERPTNTRDTAIEDGPKVTDVEANGKIENLVVQSEEMPPIEQSAETADEPSSKPEPDPSPVIPEEIAIDAKADSATAPAQSPVKTSPADARFRNIMTKPSKRNTSPTRPASKTDTVDRIVSPALHPATTALYIRNILRPLHVENLKDHLVNLATPSDQSPDPSIIAEFFLDSIRTHCLVRFSTVAAASRVRTGLHDRVWPEEKNRKPLWVDFVPEEKLPKWLEVENSSHGRGQMAKRWEVVYENEADGVKSYLQELGSTVGGGGAPGQNPQAPISRPETGPVGVRGAPSGPRVKERDPVNGPPPDRGRGFQALDDLFKSTAAKPKLYYLPVPQRTVERRLDMLAEGRGGGRGGDEMRRYTFEDGLLVDRGPEFGAKGARGGYARRARGGYVGRGGDYRGDYRGNPRRERR